MTISIASTPDNSSPYRLTISLNVLEHLGINLYSNVPAVLAEIVANAWDADATTVWIDWSEDKDVLTIRDNGTGMDIEDINDRFLTVGYRRRDSQPGDTVSGRKPMGRKGIGKLSVFAIANMVTVESAKAGSASAFAMNLDDIRSYIRNQGGEGVYRPEPIAVDGVTWEHGTRITLRDLKRKQNASSPEYLKRRIARKFSVIGGTDSDFSVLVNGQEVTAADRDYYHNLQFLWVFGANQPTIDLAVNAKVFQFDSYQTSSGGKISGWIGTVFKSNQLKDSEGENLNRIALIIRGKVAQDDLLNVLSERGVYASYLLGEIRFDHLDQYDGEKSIEDSDAATSSRQQIVEDDPRYLELLEFMTTQLKIVQSTWTELRTDDGAREAALIPGVTEWLQGLPTHHRSTAKRWIGRMNSLRVGDDRQKSEFIKHAILAFEVYMTNENLEKLSEISDDDVPGALSVFKELDDVELNLYGQIVRQRIRVIQTLEEKFEQNALELAIQEYVFDHLWLLDPSWERAEGTEVMETRIDRLILTADSDLSSEEKASRLDIKYRKSAGKHIIVELKRPKRRLRIDEIVRQITKYKFALHQLFEQANINEPFEFIILLGPRVIEADKPGGQDYVEGMLSKANARVVYYEELLSTAKRIYQDYLASQKRRNRLEEIMQSIESLDTN